MSEKDGAKDVYNDDDIDVYMYHDGGNATDKHGGKEMEKGDYVEAKMKIGKSSLVSIDEMLKIVGGYGKFQVGYYLSCTPFLFHKKVVYKKLGLRS